MPEIQTILARHCFTEFALEQSVSLETLREAAAQLALPLASTHVPEWFSAAAQPEAPLGLQAPELQLLPEEPLEVQAASAKVADIDLVTMYAPELAAARDAARAEQEDEKDQQPSRQVPATPAPASPQAESPDSLRLLKELSGLEE